MFSKFINILHHYVYDISWADIVGYLCELGFLLYSRCGNPGKKKDLRFSAGPHRAFLYFELFTCYVYATLAPNIDHVISITYAIVNLRGSLTGFQGHEIEVCSSRQPRDNGETPGRAWLER